MNTSSDFEIFFDLCANLLGIMDLSGTFLKVNSAWKNILGYESADLEGRKLTDIMHPDDLKGICNIMSLLKQDKQVLNFAGRLRAANGSYIYLEWYLQKYSERLFVSAWDVSAHISAEKALMLCEERFQLSMIGSNLGLWDWNIITGYVYYSQEWRIMLGYDQDEIGSSINSWINLMHPDDIKVIKQTINENFKSKEDALEIEFRMRRKDGSWCWVLSRGKLLRDTMNKPYRLVGVNIEINRIKEAEEKILYLSYHDQLTGLYNHRFYEEELKRLDTERNLPISIIMADVNGLKLANDAFGHMVGDELLKKASDIFKNSCRADEIIARIGGDEFVIVLPKTDYQKAQLLTNRLLHLTSSEKIANLFYLSISFGCASKTKAIEDIYEIFKKAEDSMYQQKSAVGLENKKKTIEIVLATLFERFPGEKNHAEKVRQICIAVGESMKLNPYELDALKLAAIMHDIGKISLNQEILCKPEKLDHKEWIEIKRHAEMGYRITGSVHEFSPIAKYVLHHHERWDGLGYPDRLKGEEIPLPSRIISVADAFSEMTCDRPFRNALSKEKAIQEIAKNSGTQFDPMIAEKFFEIASMF